MPSAVSRLLLICLAVLSSLSACQQETEAPQTQLAANSADTAGDEIPLGQLTAEVQPLAYQLELTINPELEEFSGKATIELDISSPRNHFFIHGKNIEAKHVQIFDGAHTYTGHYEQVNASGVVQISGPNPMSGNIRLVIEYNAPFNQSLEGLYKVSESGNDYA